MGKRKKLELKTQRRQKIKLSPSRSDDELSDAVIEDFGSLETKFDNRASPTAFTLPVSESRDETLECFLKEIKELEKTNCIEAEIAPENEHETASSMADSKQPAISHDEIVWSENFDVYYECYYYFNHLTQESTWHKPTEGKIIPFTELAGQTRPTEETVEINSEDVNTEDSHFVSGIEENKNASESPVSNEETEVREPEPVPLVDDADLQPQNGSVDVELDSFLSSPSPENLNVIINGGNLGSLGNICNFGSFGNSSDSEDGGETIQNTTKNKNCSAERDELSLENETFSESKMDERLPGNFNDQSSSVEDMESSVLIDIDEELESAFDKEHSENLMNSRMKVKMTMLIETLTSKFKIFELSSREISPLVTLFIEYNLLKNLYDENSLSFNDFVTRLCSISQQVTDFEKTIPANDRCELRWCESSKSYFYFDRLMDEKADIRPLLTNVKYDILQSSKPSQTDDKLENLSSEKSTCEFGTQVEFDDVNVLQTPEPQIAETSELDVPENNSQMQTEVQTTVIQPIEDQSDSDVDVESMPVNVDQTRNQIMQELNLPTDCNLDQMSEDPGLQYKLYKKVKRYAKEQSRNGFGSRQQIMESVWERLRLAPLFSSPYDVKSPRSVEELRDATPDNAMRSPQMDEIFSQKYLISNSASHTTSSLNNSEVDLSLPPPPPPPPPVIEMQSKDANNGIVYCLPAPTVSDYSDALFTVNSDPVQKQQAVAEIKVPPKSTAIELIVPQAPPKKKKVAETTKIAKQVVTAPANKFKNKNMGKLVDKWKKVKDEIREEPDAVEGEYYFEPRSADKWRDEQQRLQSNNPNLIAINEGKNKLKMGKSKKNPFL